MARRMGILITILLLVLAVTAMPAQAHLASCPSSYVMGLVTVATVIKTVLYPPSAAIGIAYQVLSIASLGYVTYDGLESNNCDYPRPNGIGDRYDYYGNVN